MLGSLRVNVSLREGVTPQPEKMIDKSRYGEGLACMDMAPRLLNVAYPEYPVAAGATACLGQFEVSVVAYAGRKVVVDVDGVD